MHLELNSDDVHEAISEWLNSKRFKVPVVVSEVKVVKKNVGFDSHSDAAEVHCSVELASAPKPEELGV